MVLLRTDKAPMVRTPRNVNVRKGNEIKRLRKEIGRKTFSKDCVDIMKLR